MDVLTGLGADVAINYTTKHMERIRFERRRRVRESMSFLNLRPAKYCTKLRFVRKLLIIKDILVEAAGVELITILITRNLLIPGTATKAKKAPLPDPLYVYCTKILSLRSPADPHSDHSIA